MTYRGKGGVTGTLNMFESSKCPEILPVDATVDVSDIGRSSEMIVSGLEDIIPILNH